MKLFAMLPCYNEQEDIENLVEKWIDIKEELDKKNYKLQVYCIDDKSKDNTNTIIKKLSNKYKGDVFVIEHSINKGLGGALNTAFEFFLKNGNDKDVCVLMDGDNTHDPIYTLPMLGKISEGNECVIASRYRSNSVTKGVSPLTLHRSYTKQLFEAQKLASDI